MPCRLLSIVVALLVLASACSSSSSSNEQVAAAAEDPQSSSTVAPTAEPVTPTVVPPTAVPATPTPEPTAVPPTAVPPTAVPATPTPEPTVVDTTPVIIDAGEWVITQREIDEYTRFIEETHLLEFREPVRVVVSDDIGLEFAPGYETFSDDHWYLLRALGLAVTQAERENGNQVRRDRIRGVCCQLTDGNRLQVAVEIEPTKLGTATIVIHELVHALHRQHPELYRNTSFDTDEAPEPYAAAIEGLPQFVSYEFLALAPIEDQAEVFPELPIIRDDMIPLLGQGPARYVNFAYATGPRFVEAIVEANGLEGLSPLLSNPPTTTEQVLFPEKYLAGEGAVPVPDPTPPLGADVRTSGTIGAAMLLFLLTDDLGVDAAREAVGSWGGDRFVIYEGPDSACMVANIAMDTPEIQMSFGERLIDALQPEFPDVAVEYAADFMSLRTCAEVD